MEFLPANQDGSLESLLDCVDDFLVADHCASRHVYTDSKTTRIRYYNELPPIHREDNFLTGLHVTILSSRYERPIKGVHEEYHAAFQYVDNKDTPLYSNSYFVRRFAGRLLMSAHTTADDVEGWLELQQPGVVVPALWHDGTEYDVLAFATQLEQLQKQVAV